jgi:predicted outer membrane repeat protein
VHVETEWAAGTGNSMAILGSRFTNNTSGVAGGALLVNGQSLQLQDTLFERNTVRHKDVCVQNNKRNSQRLEAAL